MFSDLKTTNPPKKQKPQTQQQEYTIRAGLKIVEIGGYKREKEQNV